MTALSAPANLLPPLRRDIEIFPAPLPESGVPAFLIHDPLHATFEQASWFQGQVMMRMDRPQTLAELLERLHRETSLQLDERSLAEFCGDIVRRGLTQATATKPVAALVKESATRNQPLWQWLIHHYLYFRIPLLFPDAFLTRALPVVRHILGLPAITLWLLLTLPGLWFLLQHPQEYLHTFPFFFDWKGGVAYGAAIIGLKCAHEFSHAFTAKALGNRVPRMGLAFILLWPIPFCDVTDSWRMRNRRKRLWISLAGILAEIGIAGPALFVWGVAPDGVVKSIAFVVSSVTLIGTIFVNLNPAMRFDGYYIFSDLLGIDNLQARSFAVTKYYLRTHLFGLEQPFPEPGLSRRRQTAMVAYSLYAWVYRFFLYLSIALLVYYAFTKAIGLVLFVVEIVLFIVAPLVREVVIVLQNRNRIHSRLRPAMLGGALFLLLGWVTIPLSRLERVPATIVPKQQQALMTPAAGIVRSFAVEHGTEVVRGQTIARIEEPWLRFEIAFFRKRIARICMELEQLQGQRTGLGGMHAGHEQLRETRARLAALERRQKQNRLVADHDGIVCQVDPAVADGTHAPARHLLARIVSPRGPAVIAYLPESLSGQLAPGDAVRFRDQATLEWLDGTVNSISPVRVELLWHPELSSLNGGPIGVQPEGHAAVPVGSWYEVRVSIVNDTTRVSDPRFGQPGELFFTTPPRSLLAEAFAYARRILIRESNL